MRLTFDQKFAALNIDVRRELTNLRRRARYAQQLDRPKVWPSDTTIGLYTWHRNPDEATRELAQLRNTTDPAEYIALWSRLNHLKA